MSLLSEAMEDCVILNKIKEDDGYGGYKEYYSEGAHFQCAIVLDSSTEAKIAETLGVSNLYTITTSKTFVLDNLDVFRRVRDGRIFRVKSDGTDNKTPNSASLDMRQVSAEEWRLPSNG